MGKLVVIGCHRLPANPGCDDYFRLLGEYLTAELDRATERKLSRHLYGERCEQCRRDLGFLILLSVIGDPESQALAARAKIKLVPQRKSKRKTKKA